MDIIIDDLTGPEVAKLLTEHHEDMHKHSPPESIHAMDLSALQSQDVTFWSAWINGELAGCGALKQLDKHHGELKSMRTARNFLRQGIAAKLLTHILNEAKKHNYTKISLETGTMAAFSPARNMYEKFGFEYCAPFAHYSEDPNSTFMTKNL